VFVISSACARDGMTKADVDGKELGKETSECGAGCSRFRPGPPSCRRILFLTRRRPPLLRRLKCSPHRDLLLSASRAPSPSSPPVLSTAVPPMLGSAGSSGSYVADELRPSMCLLSVLFSARAFRARQAQGRRSSPCLPSRPIRLDRDAHPSFSSRSVVPPAQPVYAADAMARAVASASTFTLTSASSFALLTSISLAS
jgi:hypothetical protein